MHHLSCCRGFLCHQFFQKKLQNWSAYTPFCATTFCIKNIKVGPQIHHFLGTIWINISIQLNIIYNVNIRAIWAGEIFWKLFFASIHSIHPQTFIFVAFSTNVDRKCLSIEFFYLFWYQMFNPYSYNI